MRNLLWFTILLVLATSCASLTSLQESELQPGYYRYREPGTSSRKVYLDVKDDSTVLYDANEKIIAPATGSQTFQKSSMDVDVLVVTFKMRPIASGFPRQLTADFNGNIFFGYRSDWYKSRSVKTPAGITKKFRHRSLSAGAFTGIGNTSVTPGTTHYQTTDEYNGLIVSRGLSAMVGINKITVGLGVGWDYLTDRDRDIWIYQNKPWYGLTLSLNLN